MKVTGLVGNDDVVVVLSIKLDDDGEPKVVDQDGIELIGFTVNEHTGKVRAYTLDDVPGDKYELRKGHTDIRVVI